MAKTPPPVAPVIPRLAVHDYFVHLEGAPRYHIQALSPDTAELEYRRRLELRRPNLDIRVTKVETSA